MKDFLFAMPHLLVGKEDASSSCILLKGPAELPQVPHAVCHLIRSFRITYICP